MQSVRGISEITPEHNARNQFFILNNQIKVCAAGVAELLANRSFSHLSLCIILQKVTGYMLSLIQSFLALPLQTQITIAVIVAAVLVLGSFLIGLIEDIFLLAIAILAAIFLLNFLLPFLGINI